jgi:hypothetical protein
VQDVTARVFQAYFVPTDFGFVIYGSAAASASRFAAEIGLD